jgi:UDP-N-acetylglucosamine diphosphorylase / glucose-1-phosphate thymidylyltransferase / UDP-N-acetylgalactosamine diphosphorylase / glucosamine-1-phosphate N-acetyltransferase / galactosamine-1-phosphate N-acetyltransferase
MKGKILKIQSYITNGNDRLGLDTNEPWSVITELQNLINGEIKKLSDQHFVIRENVAIHKSANVEEHCVIKGPAIISANVFIGAHAYLRGGVFIGENSVIGPGCEVKTSIIHERCALAHFNFVGDSILGSDINMEAGSVIANHYNERKDKTIYVLINNKPHAIDSTKFGALVGDGCRIGANAVLSPGTILEPGSIIKRLELVEQCPR